MNNPITFDEERGEYVMHAGEKRIAVQALPDLLAALIEYVAAAEMNEPPSKAAAEAARAAIARAAT